MLSKQHVKKILPQLYNLKVYVFGKSRVLKVFKGLKNKQRVLVSCLKFKDFDILAVNRVKVLKINFILSAIEWKAV